MTAQATPITSGLQLWLDAGDSSTITDSGGLHPGDVGFNGLASQWADKSGNGRLANAPSGNRPTYNVTALNGRATIVFNTNQFFDLNTTITTSQETMFFVTRMFDNGDNRGPWVGQKTGSNGFVNDNSRYILFTTGGNIGESNSAPTTDTIVTETRSSGITTIFEDGLAVIPGVVGANGNLIVNAIAIYGHGGARTFFGEISEILLYNRVLSSEELNAVGAFLETKYDLNTAYTPGEKG